MAAIKFVILCCLHGAEAYRVIAGRAATRPRATSPAMLMPPDLFHIDTGMAFRSGVFGLTVYAALTVLDPPGKAYERHLAKGPAEVAPGTLTFGLINSDNSLPLPSLEQLAESPRRIGTKGGSTYYLTARRELVATVAMCYELSSEFSEHYGADVFLCRS